MTDLRDRLHHEHPSDLTDEEIAAAQACPRCRELEEAVDVLEKALEFIDQYDRESLGKMSLCLLDKALKERE